MISEFEETFNAFWNTHFQNNKMEKVDDFITYPLGNKRIWLIPYSLLSCKPTANSQDIFIYQDQWNSKPNLVKSRLLSIGGKTKKINARSCSVSKIDIPTVKSFLNNNHLLEYCQTKTALGLYHNQNLVAVAAFSHYRVMNDGPVPYRSYELLRFASLENITVIGGLSKLIKHFCNLKHPAHLMTYTDNNWGETNSYFGIGFNKKENTKPIHFWINPINHKRKYRIPKIDLDSYLIGLNRGNSKWILDLRQY